MKFKDFLKEKEIETIEGMDAEELAGLYNEFNEKMQAIRDEQIAAKASKEDVAAIKDEIAEIQKLQVKHLNDRLKEMGVMIKKLTPEEKAKNALTFGEQITEALEANIDKLKSMKNGSPSEAKANEFSFETKTVGDMTSANISGGNVPIEDRIEGVNNVPSRPVRLLDVMSKRSTTSNVVSWIYQTGKEGTAGQTGEGLAKNQIDFDLVVANESVKKTTAYIKVTTEMLDDIAWIKSEIDSELMREVLKALELTSYSGDGTGVNHNGVRTTATAFSAVPFALAVDNANQVDVLAVAANQIEVAQQGEAVANYIFMHPSDVLALKLVKLTATDKRYVERLMMVGSTLFMDGIPIIKSTLITVGEYLIGDFTKAIMVTRQGIRFDIGLDGNDFTKNFRTILAEYRGLTIVKNNDRTAFVKGVFATDQAALETA